MIKSRQEFSTMQYEDEMRQTHIKQSEQANKRIISDKAFALADEQRGKEFWDQKAAYMANRVEVDNKERKVVSATRDYYYYLRKKLTNNGQKDLVDCRRNQYLAGNFPYKMKETEYALAWISVMAPLAQDNIMNILRDVYSSGREYKFVNGANFDKQGNINIIPNDSYISVLGLLWYAMICSGVGDQLVDISFNKETLTRHGGIYIKTSKFIISAFVSNKSPLDYSEIIIRRI